MVPDIEIKHYYKKYLEDANSDIKKFQEEYDIAVNVKGNIREFITERLGFISKNIGISMSDYKIEWVIGQYNPDETLLNKVYSKLEVYQEGQERIVLLQIIKYCNLLKKCRAINTAIKLAEKRSKLKFSKYRDYVAKFYQYGVQKCCLEGYAYQYGYGLGDLMINRWKYSDEDKIKKNFIDYKATNEAKAKLIAEGKTPYSKKMAEVYKLRGIKYDGVPYIVYKKTPTFYDICVVNNRYVARQNIQFEHTEYIHKELRGKSYEEIASQCLTRDSVLNLRLDIRAKLVIYNIVDKTAYLKYIRNVEQCKYKRGAHNSQNRQRF